MIRLIGLYPFSFLGNVTLAGSLFLLAQAYAQKNAYALLFGLSGFVFLLFLAGISILQRAIFRLAEMRQSAGRGLHARSAKGSLLVIVSGARSLPFFRLHVRLKARLGAGRKAELDVVHEAIASPAPGSRESVAELPLWLPVCGDLQGQVELILRDIFLFTRMTLAGPDAMHCTINAPPVSDDIPLHFEMQFNSETGQRKSISEEEKYYMREYMPGDRPKDINWKSSMRIRELITRISPYAPERTYILGVDFRNVAADAPDNPESILHLNYAKSWLLGFMFAARRQNSAYQFFLRTARSAILLKDEEEIERFIPVLSGMPYFSTFQPEQESVHQERFIFTTIFDRNLPLYLADARGVRANVFRTARRGPDPKSVRFIPMEEATCRPAFWQLRSALPVMEEKAGPAVMWIDNPLAVHIF